MFTNGHSDLYTDNVIPLGYASAAFILTGSSGTAPFVTTVGVKSTGGSISDEGWADLANELFDLYDTTLLADTSDKLVLDHVQVTFSAGGGVVSASSNAPTKAGRRTSASAPINIALLVNKFTNEAGRKGRGRMFIPGLLAQSSVSLDGTLSPADVTAYQGEVNAFFDGLAGGGTSGLDGAYLIHQGAGAGNPSPIIRAQVSPKIGSLRKRLR